MPDAAEVVALVLELLHLDHLGKPVEPLDEGIFDRLAQAPRERHELRRRKRLVVEEDDEVLEEYAADVGHDLFGQRFSKINPVNLGAEGAGKASNFHVTAEAGS